MSVFPNSFLNPLVHITPCSIESLGGNFFGINLVSNLGTSGWPTSNLAIFIPFTIHTTINVINLFIYNGNTVSGNFDLGIFDITGTRIVSTGSTANSGTSSIQSVSVSSELSPGTYYLACAFNNTTVLVSRLAVSGSLNPIAKMMGLAQMSSAFPLPATATFATYASSFVPMIGLSTRSVI